MELKKEFIVIYSRVLRLNDRLQMNGRMNKFFHKPLMGARHTEVLSSAFDGI